MDRRLSEYPRQNKQVSEISFPQIGCDPASIYCKVIANQNSHHVFVETRYRELRSEQTLAEALYSNCRTPNTGGRAGFCDLSRSVARSGLNAREHARRTQ